MVGLETPAVQGFRGNGVGFHTVLAEVAVTGGSNRHVIKRVEVSLLFKQLLESEAAFFQQLDIGFAVSHELVSKLKGDIDLFSVPGFKVLTTADRHDLRHVIVLPRDSSFVLLVFGSVKEMREIAFLEFFETEGLGKRGEGHLKERQRFNKTYSVKVHLYEFATITHLFNDTVLLVIFVHHEIAIVALKIVSDDG